MSWTWLILFQPVLQDQCYVESTVWDVSGHLFICLPDTWQRNRTSPACIHHLTLSGTRACEDLNVDGPGSAPSSANSPGVSFIKECVRFLLKEYVRPKAGNDVHQSKFRFIKPCSRSYAWVRVCVEIGKFSRQVCFYKSQRLREKWRTHVSGLVLCVRNGQKWDPCPFVLIFAKLNEFFSCGDPIPPPSLVQIHFLLCCW